MVCRAIRTTIQEKLLIRVLSSMNELIYVLEIFNGELSELSCWSTFYYNFYYENGKNDTIDKIVN